MRCIGVFNYAFPVGQYYSWMLFLSGSLGQSLVFFCLGGPGDSKLKFIIFLSGYYLDIQSDGVEFNTVIFA